MRRSLISAAAFLALLAALWLGAATGLRRAAQGVVGAPGSALTAAAVETGGFPARLFLRLRDPLWTGAHGWTWQAPQIEAQLALNRPTTIEAILPRQQILTFDGQPYTLGAANMHLTARVAPGFSLRLRDLLAEAQMLSLKDVLQADQVSALFSQMAQDNAAELMATLREISLDTALAALIPAETGLPARIEGASIRARLQFDRPLDRHALQVPPRLTRLVLQEGQLNWGPLRIRATGELRPDANSRAGGRILLEIRGWRSLLPLLVSTGAIRPDIRQTVENALVRLERPTPDGPSLDLPLKFADGQMTLALFPLGPAPRLN